MNTSIWNPLRDLETLQDRLLRAMHGIPTKNSPDQQVPLISSEWSPSVDISEDANEYLIKVELPEVSKDDVKLTVENNVLSIKGERHFEQETDNKKYHRIERGYGSFTRTFAVPEDADSERVSAEFQNGLLTVRLPKSEAKKPRQIEVLVSYAWATPAAGCAPRVCASTHRVLAQRVFRRRRAEKLIFSDG